MIDNEIQNKSVELWNQGMSVNEIREKHFKGIPGSTLYVWIKQHPNYIEHPKGKKITLNDWKMYWLYHHTNMNYREIGEYLGKTKASISSRISLLGLIYYTPPGEPPQEFIDWKNSEAPRIIEKPLNQGGVTSGD